MIEHCGIFLIYIFKIGGSVRNMIIKDSKFLEEESLSGKFIILEI